MPPISDLTFFLSDSTSIFEGEELGSSRMDSKPVIPISVVSRPRMRESIDRVNRAINNNERTLQEHRLRLDTLEQKLEGTNANLAKHMHKFESAILFQTRTESQGLCNMVERRMMELERNMEAKIAQHLELVRTELQAEKTRMDAVADAFQLSSEQSQATSDQLNRDMRVLATRVDSLTHVSFEVDNINPVSVTIPSNQDPLTATGIRLDAQDQPSTSVAPPQQLRSETKRAERTECPQCGKNLSANYLKKHREQHCRRRPL